MQQLSIKCASVPMCGCVEYVLMRNAICYVYISVRVDDLLWDMLSYVR